MLIIIITPCKSFCKKFLKDCQAVFLEILGKQVYNSHLFDIEERAFKTILNGFDYRKLLSEPRDCCVSVNNVSYMKSHKVSRIFGSFRRLHTCVPLASRNDQ